MVKRLVSWVLVFYLEFDLDYNQMSFIRMYFNIIMVVGTTLFSKRGSISLLSTVMFVSID
jgi:hypothetical protein